MRRLWLLAGVSLAGYVVLRLWMPLAPYAAPTPRPDIAAFAPWPWGVVAYTALLLGLFWVYWQAYRLALASTHQIKLAAVLLPAALFSAALLGAFPANALDIYNYLLLGRVQAIFGYNPYLVASAAIPQETWLAYAGEWGGDISPYGPVFQAAANVIARAAGDHLLAGLLLFKALAALIMLGSAVLIWLLLARSAPNRRAAHTLLWAWNPALLLIFVMNGHNDGLMIFWLLLGLWLVQRQQQALGFAVMMLAPLTKLSGLLAIPFFFLAALRALPTWRARIRLTLATAAASLVVIAAAFLPYGSPLALLGRLARTASGVGYSPMAVLVLVAQQLGFAPDRTLLAAAAMVALALVALWLAWRTWRGRSPLRAAADINVAYPLLSLGFRIWYAAWPFPWLVLDAPEAQTGRARDARNRWMAEFRLRAGIWCLLTTQLSVLIYGPMRIALLGQSVYLAHLIGVPFAFGLPLLLAWFGANRAVNRRQPDDGLSST
jgi:hypothetical protein